MPTLAVGMNRPRRSLFSAVLAPFADGRFVRLLCFGCWFSFFNGVTQTAQEIYPINVLGLALLTSLAMRIGTRAGQFAVSPWMGRLADRFGNRRVMMACMPIVATGTLFYLAATPDEWWWIAGAWIVWIAYAGVNVCLPNLMLALSPADSRTAYVAAFQTVSGLSVAASISSAGWPPTGFATRSSACSAAQSSSTASNDVLLRLGDANDGGPGVVFGHRAGERSVARSPTDGMVGLDPPYNLIKAL